MRCPPGPRGPGALQDSSSELVAPADAAFAISVLPSRRASKFKTKRSTISRFPNLSRADYQNGLDM